MSNNKSRKYSKKKRKQNRSWLPILAVTAGVVLIGMAFFSLRQNSTPKVPIEVNGSPSLKVDKDQVDLGNVKLGQTVQVSFQLTNVGDQTLRFNKQPYVEVVEGC
jgi:hypothetical protein